MQKTFINQMQGKIFYCQKKEEIPIFFNVFDVKHADLGSQK